MPTVSAMAQTPHVVDGRLADASVNAMGQTLRLGGGSLADGSLPVVVG